YGCALLMILSLILAQWCSHVFSGDPMYTRVATLLVLIISITAIIWRQLQSPTSHHFKVP
ncbi:Putative cationic amino acid transporter 3-like protein, partial [Bos mutus]